MPQLLHFIRAEEGSRPGEDTLDFATIAVFTCSERCVPAAEPYVPEFVWVQTYVESKPTVCTDLIGAAEK